MKQASVTKRAAVWLTLLGFCLPQSAVAAAPPTDQSTAVADVALRDGGLLLGRVVDPRGNAIVGTPVSLQHEDQEVAAGRTDTNGIFAFDDVRGGVHHVAAVGDLRTYRLWASGTAPPGAQESALVVGRNGAAPAPVPTLAPTPAFSPGAWQPAPLRFFQRPWVAGGIAGGVMAAAISVPIALSDNDDGPSSP